MKSVFLMIVVLIASKGLFAQQQQQQSGNPLTITGYVEVYYQYDFNNPLSNTKPGFVYSHNRNNEVNLNLGFIKAAYNKDDLRANLSLAAGTYMNSNYATEVGVMKNVFEANVGVKLSRKSNLWLDAGIFPSHIGFESAISKDCWNLTRSIMADNSPYFESGVKLGYTSNNQQWFISLLVLNGWQRIQRMNGNTTPAFGTQVTFKPSDKLTLNSSTLIGSDKPDTARQIRYFHNFYGIFQISKDWAATVGFDIGIEQTAKGSSSTNTWYSPVIIFKYAAGVKTILAARAEYYQDKNGVIIATGTPKAYGTWGFSANFDYFIAPNITWRVEAKHLYNKDRIFEKRDDSFVPGSTNLATSIAISF